MCNLDRKVLFLHHITLQMMSNLFSNLTNCDSVYPSLINDHIFLHCMEHHLMFKKKNYIRLLKDKKYVINTELVYFAQEYIPLDLQNELVQ